MSIAETLSSADTIELFKEYVIPNYTRYNVALVRGEGSYVWDSEGNRYLDLFPGWGCNLLGHCPPAVVEAVQEQVAHADPRAELLVHGSPRALGEDAFRAQLRRAGVLLQLRRGSQRSGDQAGPAAHAQRTLQDHHLHGRVPRPHAGGHLGHGPAEVSRRAWPADGRFLVCSVWRFGSRRKADRRRNRRDHDRADPGRRGRADSARRAFWQGCENWPTSTACC